MPAVLAISSLLQVFHGKFQEAEVSENIFQVYTSREETRKTKFNEFQDKKSDRKFLNLHILRMLCVNILKVVILAHGFLKTQIANAKK